MGRGTKYVDDRPPGAAFEYKSTSATQIDRFIGCKRKWALLRIWNKEEAEKDYLQVGTDIHARVEPYLKCEGDKIPDDKLKRYVQAAFKSLPTPGLDLLVEHEIWLPTYDGGPVIHGYTDFVNPRGITPEHVLIAVEDNKTTKDFYYNKTEFELRNNIQSIIYSKWAWDLPKLPWFPVPPTELWRPVWEEGVDAVTFAHVYIKKPDAKPDSTRVQADMSWATVTKGWVGLVIPAVKEMTALAANPPKDPLEIDGNPAECSKFRGCDFRSKELGGDGTCHDIKTGIFAIRSSKEKQHMEKKTSSVLERARALKAAKAAEGGAPASTPAQPAAEPKTTAAAAPSTPAPAAQAPAPSAQAPAADKPMTAIERARALKAKNAASAPAQPAKAPEKPHEEQVAEALEKLAEGKLKLDPARRFSGLIYADGELRKATPAEIEAGDAWAADDAATATPEEPEDETEAPAGEPAAPGAILPSDAAPRTETAEGIAEKNAPEPEKPKKRGRPSKAKETVANAPEVTEEGKAQLQEVATKMLQGLEAREVAAAAPIGVKIVLVDTLPTDAALHRLVFGSDPVPLDLWLDPLKQAVAAEHGEPDYRTIEFGKGPGFLAAAVRAAVDTLPPVVYASSFGNDVPLAVLGTSCLILKGGR